MELQYDSVYIKGYSRNNPGPAGLGFVFVLAGKFMYEDWVPLGVNYTGEYA